MPTVLAEQILAELDSTLTAPVRALVGMDLADELTARLEKSRADALVAQLCADDPRIAAATVIDIMAALWPRGALPPSGWWRTPLGMACAASGAGMTDGRISQREAAEWLGVTIGTIGTLVHRGSLDGDRSGVSITSVLERLVRLTT